MLIFVQVGGRDNLGHGEHAGGALAAAAAQDGLARPQRWQHLHRGARLASFEPFDYVLCAKSNSQLRIESALFKVVWFYYVVRTYIRFNKLYSVWHRVCAKPSNISTYKLHFVHSIKSIHNATFEWRNTNRTDDIDPSTLPPDVPMRKVKVIQKHVKKSRMMLNRAGIISVVQVRASGEDQEPKKVVAKLKNGPLINSGLFIRSGTSLCWPWFGYLFLNICPIRF